MPKENVHESFERIQGLSFDQLSKEWAELPEGQQKQYIVADENGSPLAPKGFAKDKRALRILVVKAEPEHSVDEHGEITRTGTSRLALEYATDLDQFNELFVGYDAAYSKKLAEKKYLYLPLDEFIRAQGPAKPHSIPPVEAISHSTSSGEQFKDLPLSRKQAIETEETSKLYLSKTRPFLSALQQAEKGDRINDPDLWRFVRTHEARFNNLNILAELESAEPGTSFRDKRTRAGLIITENVSTRRGKNLTGPVEDPLKTAKTLVIRFLQKTREMGPNEIVTEIGDEQTQDLAAVQFEISQLNVKNSAFAQALQKHGFEQVRLENVSWRKRDSYGGAYQIIVPFEGNFVDSEKA